jgi:transposase
MHFKRSFNRKTGRTYLSMVRSYWDKEKQVSRTSTIESFGYLDELEKTYDDPILHFTKYVQEKKLEQDDSEYNIVAKKNETLEVGVQYRKNYGYIIIMKIFYELGLERFMMNWQQRNTKVKYSCAAILKLLVISRILSPGSKKKAFEEKSRYFDFERENIFELMDIYRFLSHFAHLEKKIQLHLHNRISKQYGRNLDLIYYDVTNYYFEIDEEDDLRKKGYSKDGKKTPLVQMGLAMDSDGIPISYELFPGNESEKLHLRPTVLELRSKFDSGKVIAVADSAQNTGNNIYYLDSGKQGYVFSQSIAGGSANFKEYVIEPDGYAWKDNEYKRKSRIERREIKVDFVRSDGTTYKKTVLVDQRQIVFYSEKYAVRARSKREAIIMKAQQIIDNPAAYNKATSYGALKYIKNIEIDKSTGEFKELENNPYLDIAKLKEEEKYDGYYAIVTNVFDEGKKKGKFDDEKIIDIYRGLWRIEDTFRVTKSELEARPVNVSREERIRAHFSTCFISLVIIKLIQKRINYKHSPEKIIEAMNNTSCSNESENLFLFDHVSEVSIDLGEAFGLDFSIRRLTRKEIKKNLSQVKK